MADLNEYSVQDPKSVEDLAKYAQVTLQSVTEKFEGTSTRILGRIDQIGSTIDDLEKEIAGLMTQAGVDDSKHTKF